MISKESLMDKLMGYNGSVPLGDLYKILDNEIDVAPDRGSFVITDDVTHLHTDDWMEIWGMIRKSISPWLIHSYGVAEKMYQMTKDNGGSDSYAENMWLLGLLHDIGKKFGGHEGHEERGASILSRNGFVFSDCVAKHGDVPEIDIPGPLEYLLRCDMTVDKCGEAVGIDERLNGIASRHGKESEAYRISEGIASYLAERCSDEDSAVR